MLRSCLPFSFSYFILHQQSSSSGASTLSLAHMFVPNERVCPPDICHVLLFRKGMLQFLIFFEINHQHELSDRTILWFFTSHKEQKDRELLGDSSKQYKGMHCRLLSNKCSSIEIMQYLKCKTMRLCTIYLSKNPFF